MTRTAARTVANVVMVSAGVAIAYAVVTTPSLRRLATVLARRWLGPSVAVSLLSEARRAWNASSPAAVQPGAARHPRSLP